MIATCVHIYVKTESVSSFIEKTIANHRATIEESGNLRFDILQLEDDPCSFMIYEVFESQDAIDAHKETEHYLTWRDSVKDYMAETRYGIKYKIIEPTERTKW